MCDPCRLIIHFFRGGRALHAPTIFFKESRHGPDEPDRKKNSGNQN